MSVATLTMGRWDELAGALRGELAEYGGLLAMLDEQRDAIVSRQVDRLVEMQAEIEAQSLAARQQRQARDRLAGDLAMRFGGRSDIPLRELLPLMPPSTRPMFEALLDGGSELVEKARDKARRNRVLLSRASEVNEEILRRLQPRSMTKTYNARGTVAVRTGRTGGLDLSA